METLPIDSRLFLLSFIDLAACTQNEHVSIPNIAELIFERISNSSWVVVFKAECTFHHLMSYGNEVRFVDCFVNILL